MLRLKDKELQRKLDELSDGDFSISLKNVKDEDLLHKEDDVVCTVVFGKTVAKWSGICEYKKFSAIFKKDELEEIPEYNPDDWNKFPEVFPPESVAMRVDTIRDGCGFKAQFIDGQWFDMRGDALFDGPYGDGIEGSVIRFRPWED